MSHDYKVGGHGANTATSTVNGEEIKTYTYGDAEWHDLLTAFNCESITYDAIGNPITYYPLQRVVDSDIIQVFSLR